MSHKLRTLRRSLTTVLKPRKAVLAFLPIGSSHSFDTVQFTVSMPSKSHYRFYPQTIVPVDRTSESLLPVLSAQGSVVNPFLTVLSEIGHYRCDPGYLASPEVVGLASDRGFGTLGPSALAKKPTTVSPE